MGDGRAGHDESFLLVSAVFFMGDGRAWHDSKVL